MLAIGVHLSISKGLLKALDQAKSLDSNAMQVFIRNPRGYAKKVLDSNEVKKFIERRKEYGIDPLVIHGSYLLNIASSDERIRDKSISAIVEDLKLLSQVAAEYYVLHFGSNPDKVKGLNIMRESLIAIFKRINFKPLILLENTAGEGDKLGWEIDDFKDLLKGKKGKLGICLDSAHLFASGVDLGNSRELDAFLMEFDKKVGVDSIKLLHLNDSNTPCCSKRDRHAHIGEGFIKSKGISNFINHPKLKRLPIILETPKGKEKDDIKNLNKVKYLKRNACRFL
ncbi:MAG: deoxyribonuclease IV [Candidatus Kaelpia aquatica]|nr:deoxyribonuclease IV [Candidatus Kaelpia aquatica]